MTFDLTEARRLHDRDGDDPRHCLTCRDDDGACIVWPCQTATALGATGRSEWTGATFDTETTRCRSIAPGGLPCMGDTGHISRHWNTQTANRWLDPGQIPCDGKAPGGWHCDLTTGHTGNHRGWNGDTW